MSIVAKGPLVFIWVLQIKIISLILSKVKHYGQAKMGDPPEKPPDHPQAELGSSPVTRARLEPTAVSAKAIVQEAKN